MPNAGLQLRRAISIQAEGKKLLERHAIAPSAARLCSAFVGIILLSRIHLPEKHVRSCRNPYGLLPRPSTASHSHLSATLFQKKEAPELVLATNTLLYLR